MGLSGAELGYQEPVEFGDAVICVPFETDGPIPGVLSMGLRILVPLD